ncbi:MAG: EAL domain-containing protein [Wenzhouxiangella sp.]
MYRISVSDGQDSEPVFEIFPWNDHFETGIAAIDRQHRRLVSLLNQVASVAVTDSVEINLDELLDELAAYARFHFEAEEAIWARRLEGEEVLADHRQVHAGFLETVQALYQPPDRQETLHEILAFLTHWLACHILQDDREMALVLHHVDRGLSVAEARRAAEVQMRQASPVILGTVLQMQKQMSRQTLELIGERKACSLAEAELALAQRRHDEDRYGAVFDSSSDGILVLDIDSARVEKANRSACELFGLDETDLVGRHVTELHPPERKDEIIREFARFIEPALDSRLVETWIRRADGQNVAVEISGGKQFSDQTGRHTVASLRDISIRREVQNQLEYIAYHDPLTGLGNRPWILEAMAGSMAVLTGEQDILAVLTLDIDRFRRINEAHGQEFGDELLIRLARRWEELLEPGCHLARLGGDEFVVVVPKISNRNDAHRIATQLIQAGKNLIRFEGKTLSISLSAGITYCTAACRSEGRVEPDILLRQADQAMYQAKLKGRSRFEDFDAQRELIVQQQHETINALQIALERDELVLHYQPKVNLRTGRILGLEALIRWQHPERGLLAPATFLPAIEGHPLSIPLGEWVIEAALRQMRAWKAAGLDLPVSVNVGSLQLQDAEFPNSVQRLLDGFPELDPKSLELEVLESGALDNMERAVDNLTALHAIGPMIAIDDFGTGYSSLTYLKQIPAHTLKIDRSFVHDMLDEPSELPLLIGIITLAESFGMVALAEGVETVEHGRLLLELGCEQAQGYCIARPMAPDQVPAWTEQWKPDPRWQGVEPVLRQDLAGFSAISAHRRWLSAMHAWLSRPLPIELPEDPCELTDWLNSQPPDCSPRQTTLFDDIRRLHEQMHNQSRSWPESGTMEEGVARIEGMQATNDKLVDRLRQLLQLRAQML